MLSDILCSPNRSAGLADDVALRHRQNVLFELFISAFLFLAFRGSRRRICRFCLRWVSLSESGYCSCRRRSCRCLRPSIRALPQSTKKRRNKKLKETSSLPPWKSKWFNVGNCCLESALCIRISSINWLRLTKYRIKRLKGCGEVRDLWSKLHIWWRALKKTRNKSTGNVNIVCQFISSSCFKPKK